MCQTLHPQSTESPMAICAKEDWQFEAKAKRERAGKEKRLTDPKFENIQRLDLE